jgi:hypothetical protein
MRIRRDRDHRLPDVLDAAAACASRRRLAAAAVVARRRAARVEREPDARPDGRLLIP